MIPYPGLKHVNRAMFHNEKGELFKALEAQNNMKK